MDLQIKFASRKAGSFGTSPVGKVAEWATTTWLRFTCLLFTIPIIVFAVPSNLPIAEKAALVLLAPLISLIYWYIFLFLILICRYLGLAGRLLAHLLVIYFYLFAWLIVQNPPYVHLPLISRR